MARDLMNRLAVDLTKVTYSITLESYKPLDLVPPEDRTGQEWRINQEAGTFYVGPTIIKDETIIGLMQKVTSLLLSEKGRQLCRAEITFTIYCGACGGHGQVNEKQCPQCKGDTPALEYEAEELNGKKAAIAEAQILGETGL